MRCKKAELAGVSWPSTSKPIGGLTVVPRLVRLHVPKAGLPRPRGGRNRKSTSKVMQQVGF